MFKEEIVKRKKKEYNEEMLVTLELIEAQREDEMEIYEITGSYADQSYDSIFGDLQPGYDY